VACCLAAQQRALAGQAWPGGVAVRVRMGPHSGAPVRHQDGYVGMDVHRTARIMAAAHGGQVVLSDATRLPVASRLPAGVLVRDLGLHRLKDLPTPERIYQLVGPGLEEGFPPLKSLGAAPTAFRCRRRHWSAGMTRSSGCASPYGCPARGRRVQDRPLWLSLCRSAEPTPDLVATHAQLRTPPLDHYLLHLATKC